MTNEQLNIEGYVTIAEASKISGLKQGTIRDYLAIGKFKKYKLKSLTLLRRDEVENYQRREKS